MMRKIFAVLVVLSLLSPGSRAEEGMWIPILLEQLNIKRMQDLGLRLSAEDIYSVNQSSLKDAIVQFGGGCTAEIVSSQGLILTNHHCGLGAIQRLSSLEHDYLAKGFWAQSFEEELPCPGLSVTLLVRMEDVTSRALEGVTDVMNQFERNQVIRLNCEKIEKEAVNGTRYEARVRPFFYGNNYYLFVNEVFKDVRLVGAPPSSIGKFGGDTDNWMWPRHTGDFSIFRIYADRENQPAGYSKDNQPYRPKKFLRISLKGYKENDFTFIFGYPGTTREYLTSYGVDMTANKENPLRISIRQQRLDIINAGMDDSRLVRIQYTAKAAGIANYWKKMIGESRGIRKIDGIGRKVTFENGFRDWYGGLADAGRRYGNLLDTFASVYGQLQSPLFASVYLSEAGMGIESVRFAAGYRDLVKVSQVKDPDEEKVTAAVEKLKRSATEFFRNYSADIDRKTMAEMLLIMDTGLVRAQRPTIYMKNKDLSHGRYGLYSDRVFASSLFTDSLRMTRFLNGYQPGQVKKLLKDPVFTLMTSIYERYEQDIVPVMTRYSGSIDSLQRIYMAAQMEMQPRKVFYPDANSTLRIAYGKVEEYSPADAVTYDFYTTLAGVMQKEDTSVYDYQVDARLRELYANREFGPYADPDGTLHVAFIASNHTTGGNSGSPVLDADGNLIGINFDRNWEGTLSDLMYDPTQCRNIALDIRYCLFVIDTFAGCKRLISEMELVQR